MEFTKMHGSGNDYVYVNGSNLSLNWGEIASSISDRHTGIGSDGLIVALPSTICDIKMRMFNADGSEGEMCGNGIRCLVSFARSEKLVNMEKSKVTVETGAGIITVTPIIEKSEMIGAKVNMGVPILDPLKIPVLLNSNSNHPILDHKLTVKDKILNLSFISMGNPHAISFLEEDVDEFPLNELGPIVETNKIFPHKVNFEIVNIINRKKLKARVWERGSGITMACGTGACAIVVAARYHNIIGDDCDVVLPGGTLHIEWSGSGPVYMTGPVKTVFKGYINQ